ncbi:MAG: hypothetical protein ACRYF3_06280 [Janthinobacterium lividum]
MTPDQPRSVRALLRRSVLALSVLEDVDVDLDDDGVRLPGCTPLQWSDVARQVGVQSLASDATRLGSSAATGDDVTRLLVHDLLLAHRELHRGTIRTVALAVPVEAERHPGGGWSHLPVLGGALDLGLGVVVRRGAHERTLPVPVVSARSTGRPAALAPEGVRHLEEMGDLAVQRLVRDAGTRGAGVLRPMGGCDVPTLLAAASLREHLVARPDGTSGKVLRAVAVPNRTRGWFDLARIDPVYVGAAFSATDLADRGAPHPLLVTRDEVARAPRHPRMAAALLQD